MYVSQNLLTPECAQVLSRPMHNPHIPRPAAATKKKKPGLSTRLLEGGDDLLSRFRSTIGAMKLNFSVRDGKRWILHAIITLMS